MRATHPSARWRGNSSSAITGCRGVDGEAAFAAVTAGAFPSRPQLLAAHRPEVHPLQLLLLMPCLPQDGPDERADGVRRSVLLRDDGEQGLATAVRLPPVVQKGRQQSPLVRGVPGPDGPLVPHEEPAAVVGDLPFGLR